MSLKIICDENITFAEEAFSGKGNLNLLPGREIKNHHLIDADILIVRSITEVNEELLKNTNIKFVGTATIGTDHFDKKYLEQAGIKFASAPGCNSFAVSEWVISAVLFLTANFKLSPKTAAVIGYGNIGTKVAQLFSSIGLEVKIVDPPKAEIEKRNDFFSIDEVLDCDIITFHTPISKSGNHPTFHLMNEKRLSEIREGTILLNSSRGSVVNNSALLIELKRRNLHTAIDVWENEPKINLELLGKVNIATPHIAGYSLEGKVNGTKMIYDELCDFLEIKKEWKPELQNPEITLTVHNSENLFSFLHEIVQQIYHINIDDGELRDNPNAFDLLRKKYQARREFNNYLIKKERLTAETESILKNFRINIL